MKMFKKTVTVALLATIAFAAAGCQKKNKINAELQLNLTPETVSNLKLVDSGMLDAEVDEQFLIEWYEEDSVVKFVIKLIEDKKIVVSGNADELDNYEVKLDREFAVLILNYIDGTKSAYDYKGDAIFVKKEVTNTVVKSSYVDGSYDSKTGYYKITQKSKMLFEFEEDEKIEKYSQLTFEYNIAGSYKLLELKDISLDEYDKKGNNAGEKFNYYIYNDKTEHHYNDFDVINNYIVDKDGNVLHEIPSYHCEYYAVGNGVIYQTYVEDNNNYNFDYKSEGKKYRVYTYFYNVKENKLTELKDFKYFICDSSDMKEYADFNSVVYGVKIEAVDMSYEFDSQNTELDIYIDENGNACYSAQKNVPYEYYVKLDNNHYVALDQEMEVWMLDAKGNKKFKLYDYATYYEKNKVICVRDSNNMWAFIDYDGNQLTAYKYNHITYLSDDLAIGEINNEYYFMNVSQSKIETTKIMDYCLDDYEYSFGGKEMDKQGKGIVYTEGIYATYTCVDADDDTYSDYATVTFNNANDDKVTIEKVYYFYITENYPESYIIIYTDGNCYVYTYTNNEPVVFID